MTIEEQYAVMHTHLNERQWRVFLGTEAQKIGAGGITQVARFSRADRKTVRRGVVDSRLSPLQDRIRMQGGGRKKLIEKDPTLLKDIESLIDPKGDPMSLTQWTTKSLTHLVGALVKKNHRIEETALARILTSQHFSLKANKLFD
jgi:hypothetical protein